MLLGEDGDRVEDLGDRRRGGRLGEGDAAAGGVLEDPVAFLDGLDDGNVVEDDKLTRVVQILDEAVDRGGRDAHVAAHGAHLVLEACLLLGHERGDAGEAFAEGLVKPATQEVYDGESMR